MKSGAVGEDDALEETEKMGSERSDVERHEAVYVTKENESLEMKSGMVIDSNQRLSDVIDGEKNIMASKRRNEPRDSLDVEKKKEALDDGTDQCLPDVFDGEKNAASVAYVISHEGVDVAKNNGVFEMKSGTVIETDQCSLDALDADDKMWSERRDKPADSVDLAKDEAQEIESVTTEETNGEKKLMAGKSRVESYEDVDNTNKRKEVFEEMNSRAVDGSDHYLPGVIDEEKCIMANTIRDFEELEAVNVAKEKETLEMDRNLDRTDQSLPAVIDGENNMASESCVQSHEDVDETKGKETLEETNLRAVDEIDRYSPDARDEEKKIWSERHDEPTESVDVTKDEALEEEMKSVTLDETEKCLSDVINSRENTMASEQRLKPHEDFDETKENEKLVTLDETGHCLSAILDEIEKIESARHDVDETKAEMMESKSLEGELSSESNSETIGTKNNDVTMIETATNDKNEIAVDSVMNETKENETIEEHRVNSPFQPVITNVTTLETALTDENETQVSVDCDKSIIKPTVDDNEIQIEFEAFPINNPTIKIEPVSDDEVDFPVEVVMEEEKEKLCFVNFDNNDEMSQRRRALRSSFGAPVKNYKMYDESEGDDDDDVEEEPDSLIKPFNSIEEVVFKEECLRRRAVVVLRRCSLLPLEFAKFMTENETDFVVQVSPEAVFMCERLDTGKREEVWEDDLNLQIQKQRRETNAATYSRRDLNSGADTPANVFLRKFLDTSKRENVRANDLTVQIQKRATNAAVTYSRREPNSAAGDDTPENVFLRKFLVTSKLENVRGCEYTIQVQKQKRATNTATYSKRELNSAACDPRRAAVDNKRESAAAATIKRLRAQYISQIKPVKVLSQRERLVQLIDNAERRRIKLREHDSLQAQLNRKKRAQYESERMKQVRANSTAEQRVKRHLYEVEKYRRRIARETPEKREQRRLQKNALRLKRKLENETPEQREKRLAREAKKMARENETPEQRREREEAAFQRRKEKMASETPEERLKRIQAAAERYRNRLVKTKVVKPVVEKKPRQREAERRAKRLAEIREETPEERKKRLALAGERMKLLLAKRKGTAAQQEKRMAAVAKRMQIKKISKWPETRDAATETEKNNEASKTVRNNDASETVKNNGVSESVKNSEASDTEMNNEAAETSESNTCTESSDSNTEPMETAKQRLAAAGVKMIRMIAVRKGSPQRCQIRNTTAPADTGKKVASREPVTKQQRLSAAGERMKQRLAKRQATPEQRENVDVAGETKRDETVIKQQRLSAAGERMKQQLLARRKGTPKPAAEKQLAAMAKRMDSKMARETTGEDREKRCSETAGRAKRGAAVAAAEKMKQFQAQESEKVEEDEEFSDCYRVFGIGPL